MLDKMIPGSFGLMKKMNRTLILDVIRQQGPISRSQIARMTHLTPPTVTNVVKELIRSDMVVEGEHVHSTGGRKAINLHINPTACYVIGVRVGVSRITAVVTDLQADIVNQHHFDLQQGDGGDEVISKLKTCIQTVMDHSDINQDKFKGIGIGMHGVVQSEQGLCVFAPNLGMRNVPLKDILQEQFALPVLVDNDVRAMALGESWYGHGQKVDNFIFIHVGSGIGAGIIMGEELYRGVNESAGEIGHTTVVEEGPICNCGNQGCLEVMAAAPAIVKRSIERMNQGVSSSLKQELDTGSKNITAKMIYKHALQKDALSLSLLEDTGKYLGIGIANLINILNPEKVIIGGGVSQAGDLLFKPLLHTVRQRAMEIPANVQIEQSYLGQHVGPVGAATLVLKQIFKG